MMASNRGWPGTGPDDVEGLFGWLVGPVAADGAAGALLFCCRCTCPGHFSIGVAGGGGYSLNDRDRGLARPGHLLGTDWTRR